MFITYDSVILFAGIYDKKIKSYSDIFYSNALYRGFFFYLGGEMSYNSKMWE